MSDVLHRRLHESGLAVAQCRGITSNTGAVDHPDDIVGWSNVADGCLTLTRSRHPASKHATHRTSRRARSVGVRKPLPFGR